jgi:hypothetical protein
VREYGYEAKEKRYKGKRETVNYRSRGPRQNAEDGTKYPEVVEKYSTHEDRQTRITVWEYGGNRFGTAGWERGYFRGHTGQRVGRYRNSGQETE